MRTSLRLSLLAAVVASATARSAAAQTAPASDVVRSIVTYRFVGWRGTSLPTEVSVADSAGIIVASYKTARSDAARPMHVTLQGSDVVLQGMTTAGPLTLELYGQNDLTSVSPLTGHWTLGRFEGDLRGTIAATVATAAQP